jgi:hypothetical protein
MLRHMSIMVVTLIFLSFSDVILAADTAYGKWHMVKVNQGRIFPSSADIDELSRGGNTFPEAARWPSRTGKNYGWASPGPLPKSQEYQPYALLVREYGYTFIEATKDGSTEHLKWGWKMLVENKSKNDVATRVYCTLRDKDDFLLTTYDDDDDVTGTIIWKGGKATLQDETIWSFNRNTKPYPPGRVRFIRCQLLLKHVETGIDTK